MKTSRHDNGRYQTQQQLRNIKGSWLSRSCALPPWIIVSAAFCLGLWVINLIFGILVDENTRGSFGDTFGAVNSMFSAFALLGIAWGISQQRQQLEQTREELNVAKDDREDTRSIFRDQQINLRQERFETTFFHLFTAFQELIDSLSVDVSITPQSSSTDKANGKLAFVFYLKYLTDYYEADIRGFHYAELENLPFGETYAFENTFYSANLAVLENTYEKFFDRYGDSIGRYFRSLYTIIKYIDESPIEGEKKYFYCKLLRAQLTPQESSLLAINMISGYSTESFNYLIVKYGMAKNSDFNNDLVKHFLRAIPFAAFGRSYVERFIDAGVLPNVHGASCESDALEHRVIR